MELISQGGGLGGGGSGRGGEAFLDDGDRVQTVIALALC